MSLCSKVKYRGGGLHQWVTYNKDVYSVGSITTRCFREAGPKGAAEIEPIDSVEAKFSERKPFKKIQVSLTQFARTDPLKTNTCITVCPSSPLEFPQPWRPHPPGISKSLPVCIINISWNHTLLLGKVFDNLTF